jgi:hypothetical protein
VVQTAETELAWKFNFKSGFGGMMAIINSNENVGKEFWLSDDVSIPKGEYNFTQFVAHMNTTESKKIMLAFDTYAGTFYDGTRLTLGLEPQWNIGSSLQLSLAYEYNRVNFADRNELFTGNIARFKALAMFTTKLSVSAFVQYNSAENNLSSNIRFRFNPREGNDLYLVFNDGRSTNRDSEFPALPSFNSRSVLLKYTYTFTL